MAAGVCAGVAVSRRVGALDFGRYLRDPACCRGWAFLRGISSVLGRPPRAHSSTGGRLGCLRGAQPAAWLRRFRQRWRPVMKWMPTSCRLANPQPPEVGGSARALAGSWPERRVSGPPASRGIQCHAASSGWCAAAVCKLAPAGRPPTHGGRTGGSPASVDEPLEKQRYAPRASNPPARAPACLPRAHPVPVC